MQLLEQGCVSYLAYIVEAKQIHRALEEIDVVYEYLDVFLNKLLGLPPN